MKEATESLNDILEKINTLKAEMNCPENYKCVYDCYRDQGKSQLNA